MASFEIKVLFCVGGKQSSKYMASTWIYIIKTDTWTEGPVMLTPRAGHACCTLGPYLYAVAGFNKLDGLVHSVERIPMNACIRGSCVHSEWNNVNVYGYLSRFPIVRYLFSDGSQNTIVIFGGKSGYHGYAAKVGITCMSKIMCLIEVVNPF